MAKNCLECVVNVIFVTMVASYPYGPPATDYICRDMFPVGHNSDADSRNPEFEIKMSMSLYTPWEKIYVTLQSTGNRTFKGYFLQARRANCSHPHRQEAVGYFEPNTPEMRPMDCLKHQKSAVSHSSSAPKTVQEVMWYAPGTEIGPIYFVATVVESKGVFWTNVYSQILRDIEHHSKGQICPARKLQDPTEPDKTEPATTPKPLDHKSDGTTVYISWLSLLSALSFATMNVT